VSARLVGARASSAPLIPSSFDLCRPGRTRAAVLRPQSGPAGGDTRGSAAASVPQRRVASYAPRVRARARKLLLTSLCRGMRALLRLHTPASGRPCAPRPAPWRARWVRPQLALRFTRQPRPQRRLRRRACEAGRGRPGCLPLNRVAVHRNPHFAGRDRSGRASRVQPLYPPPLFLDNQPHAHARASRASPGQHAPGVAKGRAQAAPRPVTAA
jgi:hypothetical protein